MNCRLIWILLLGSLVSSCSKDGGADSLVQDAYVSVTLNVNNDIEDDGLRSVRFTMGENDKPRFQFTNATGEISGTRKVYTTITKGEGSASEVIYEGELDWDIQQDGRRLAYNGELKILHSKFKDATNLMLHAVTGERQFSKTGSEKQTELFASDDKYHIVNVEVPYVMSTPVKKVGKETLTLSNPSSAKFKPKGVLTLFTIKNSLAVGIRPLGLKIYSAKYHRGINVSKYGELELSDSREDTPLLHKNGYMSPIKSQSKTTLIAWLPKEDIASIKEVRYLGVGMQGKLTKTSGSGEEGSLVSYEIEFKPQKQSLDRGLAYTDNFGNVVPYMSVDGSGSSVGPLFTHDEVQGLTTSEDAWLLKYYFPMWVGTGIINRGIPIESPDKYGDVWDTDNTTLSSENYWRKEDKDFSQKTDWIILNRKGQHHQEKSLFAYTKDNPGYMEGACLYIARFVDNEEYRVLQRIRANVEVVDDRFYYMEYHHMPNMEVSFLPYDEEAVRDKTAFTKAYWDKKEQLGAVQVIRFRANFSVISQGPDYTYNHLLQPETSSGLAFWWNTMRNFEDPLGNDPAEDIKSGRAPIIALIDKLPK